MSVSRRDRKGRRRRRARDWSGKATRGLGHQELEEGGRSPPPEPLRGSGRFGSPALAAGRSCRGRKWQKRLPGCALADRARPDWARRPVNTDVDR